MGASYGSGSSMSSCNVVCLGSLQGRFGMGYFWPKQLVTEAACDRSSLNRLCKLFNCF